MQPRMQHGRLLAAVGGIIVGVLGGAAFAQSNNEVGIWKLDVAKSKYSPGPAPLSGTTNIEAAGAGVKVTVDQTFPGGITRHWEYTADYGGNEVPVTGNNPDVDTVARRHLNATTVEMVNRKAGKITTTNRAVVSRDGKTRTVTTTGTNAEGQTVNNVAVFEKR